MPDKTIKFLLSLWEHGETLHPACRCKCDKSQTGEELYKAFHGDLEPAC